MGFKMKGFPTRSSNSALKQVSPLKDYQMPDANPHNQPGNHLADGSHISGGGGNPNVPTQGAVLCPYNLQSGGTPQNPTGGLECQWYTEASPTAFDERAQHLQTVHPSTAPVVTEADQELTIDDMNLGGGNNQSNVNITRNKFNPDATQTVRKR